MPFRRGAEQYFGTALLVLATAWPALLAEPLESLTGLDAYLEIPEDNPLTPEKVALGKRLFFDAGLSVDGSVACATCHDPQRGFTDERPVAEGVQGRRGTRRTPKLLNRGYGRSFFWDGRAATLEEQAFKPILNPLEMALTEEEAVRRVRSDLDYASAFRRVFEADVDARAISKALASYVRTIRSGDAPVDRFVAGDSGALDAAQKRGLELFRSKANCVLCHLGPNFTDEDFHNTGVGWQSGEPADRGRAEVTGRVEDSGKFKTPTLREVASTPPYMHDGSLATLREVIDFYNQGGVENPYLDRDIEPLGLSESETADLLDFLNALSGRVVDGLQASVPAR